MRIRRRHSLARVGIATLTTGGALLAVPVGQAGAATVTETFNFTNGAQTWTVPAGVTQVTIEVFGAQGGAGVGFGDSDGTPSNTTQLGGLGGRAWSRSP